ncbi:MAG TPA: hypothetical protein V6D09_00815 [Leptolyngbyaceae cyanobacterium]
MELLLEAVIAQNLECLIKQFTRLLEETQVERNILYAIATYVKLNVIEANIIYFAEHKYLG